MVFFWSFFYFFGNQVFLWPFIWVRCRMLYIIASFSSLVRVEFMITLGPNFWLWFWLSALEFYLVFRLFLLFVQMILARLLFCQTLQNTWNISVCLELALYFSLVLPFLPILTNYYILVMIAIYKKSCSGLVCLRAGILPSEIMFIIVFLLNLSWNLSSEDYCPGMLSSSSKIYSVIESLVC